jgi:catechol 2,3-dioxygenase-like lactoylglutathione lyase family enzyme
MIEALSAVTLATHDMARSVAFYTALGFALRSGGPEVGFTSFRAGNGYLNLTAVGQAQRWSGWGRAIFHVDGRGCGVCARRGGRIVA